MPTSNPIVKISSGPGYGSSSTSSVTIGTGSKSFSVPPGLAYSAGARVRVWYDATHYMEGQVTSYGGTTLTINADTAVGTGTYSVWTVNLAGETGSTGPAGPTGPGYLATSTTSVSIATGTKTFTTQTGLAYAAGVRARAFSASDSTKWMEGVVSSYSGTTLTINVDAISTGSTGPYSDWTFTVTGQQGAQGIQGLPGAGAQTPWISNIDAAGYKLGNAGDVGIGVAVGANTYRFEVRGGFSLIGGYNSGPIVPPSHAGGGMIAGWNRSGGQAEVNLYNAYDNPGVAFQFSAKTGASTYRDLMTLAGDGKVGIGTTSPSELLEVEGNCLLKAAQPTLKWQLASGATAYVPSIYIDTTPHLIINSPSGGGQVIIAINGSGKVNVAQSGKVGINQGSPAYQLDVNGDINISAGSSFRVNGTPISTSGGVTTQTIYGPATRVLGTPYPNASGRPMFVTVAVGVSGGASGMSGGLQVQTDATANPSGTAVMVALAPTTGGGGGGTVIVSASFWVLTGNYYKVSANASGTGTAPTVTMQVLTEWT